MKIIPLTEKFQLQLEVVEYQDHTDFSMLVLEKDKNELLSFETESTMKKVYYATLDAIWSARDGFEDLTTRYEELDDLWCELACMSWKDLMEKEN